MTANYLTKVIVGKDTLTTTPNHPFYVPQQEQLYASAENKKVLSFGEDLGEVHWLQAGSLRKGALILLASGLLSTVDTAYTYAATEKVYNFEIAEHHNYYVGESGVLVHNGNCIVEAINNFLTTTNLSAAQKADFLAKFKDKAAIFAKFKNGELSLEAWTKIAHKPQLSVNENVLENLTKLYNKLNAKYPNLDWTKIIDNLSGVERQLATLAKLKDLGGINEVLADIAKGGNFTQGATFIIDYIEKKEIILSNQSQNLKVTINKPSVFMILKQVQQSMNSKTGTTPGTQLVLELNS